MVFWLVLALLASIGVHLGLAAFLLVRRQRPGARALAGDFVAAALWTLGYLGGLLAPDLSTKLAWWYVQSVGTVFLVPCWLLFTVRYTWPTRRVPRWLYACLAIDPLLLLGLVLAHDPHHLLLTSLTLQPHDGLSALERSGGPALRVQVVYTFLLVATGCQLLLLCAYRTGGLFRLQSLALLAAALLAAAASAVWQVTGPWLWIDPTPFVLAGTASLEVYLLTRLRLLNLAPIARDAIFELASDGILVLDEAGRIVDGNASAHHLLGLAPAASGRPPGGQGRGRGQGQGQVLAELLPSDAWRHALRTARQTGVSELTRSPVPGAGETASTVEVRALALGQPPTQAQGSPLGTLLLLRDVTAQKAAAEATAHVRQEQARLDGVLLAARTAEHEINNHLAITLGYTELLAGDGSLPERARGFAAEARRGAAEAAAIIQRLASLRSIRERQWGGLSATLDLRQPLSSSTEGRLASGRLASSPAPVERPSAG